MEIKGILWWQVTTDELVLAGLNSLAFLCDQQILLFLKRFIEKVLLLLGVTVIIVGRRNGLLHSGPLVYDLLGNRCQVFVFGAPACVFLHHSLELANSAKIVWRNFQQTESFHYFRRDLNVWVTPVWQLLQPEA